MKTARSDWRELLAFLLLAAMVVAFLMLDTTAIDRWFVETIR